MSTIYRYIQMVKSICSFNQPVVEQLTLTEKSNCSKIRFLNALKEHAHYKCRKYKTYRTIFNHMCNVDALLWSDVILDLGVSTACVGCTVSQPHLSPQSQEDEHEEEEQRPEW